MSKVFSAHAVSVDELGLRLGPRRGVCAREATPRAVGGAGVRRFPVSGVGAAVPTRQAHQSRPPAVVWALAQRARRRVLPQPGLRGRRCSAGGPSRRSGAKSSRPWSSSGSRSTSATAPKQSSLAGTASKRLAPSTTSSAGPDASFWRRTRSCCGPSSKAPAHRWPSEGSGCCSTTVNLREQDKGEIGHARRHSIHVDVTGRLRRQRP
jgi:hypothetical protein